MLTALALGPALGPGLVLSYDMVAVPDPSWSWDQLGVGQSLPRAVPLDAVVTALTTVLPAALLQKAVLAGALVAAGVGAAALVPRLPVTARLVAATLAVWNPYVAERLVLGHWGLLVAYGALPWLVASVRAGSASPWHRRVLLLAACALTPTGGLLALLVLAAGVTTTIRRGTAGDRRALAVAGAAWLLVNAPWWLPGLLRGSAATTSEASVAAFAARAELPGGVVTTLLGLGGIWNSEVVPDSRETPFAVVALVLLLGLAAAGVRGAARADRPQLGLITRLGGLGLLLALLGAVPGVQDVLAAGVTRVPGLGLLRDGHKFVAAVMPLLAVLVAHGAAAAAGRARDRTAAVTVTAGAALLQVALLPDLAWGVAGRLDAVRYPAAWARVHTAVVAERPDGDLLLLPWSTFRRYAWNGGRTVLDPAGRAFPTRALGDDRLPVGATVLPGEDPRAADVRIALRRGDLDADRLRDLGVRLVLLQEDQPQAAAAPPGLVLVARAGALSLFRVPGQVAEVERPVGDSARALVVAADLLAVALVAAAAARTAGPVSLRRRRATGQGP